MVNILLPNEQRLLTHSSIYNFVTEHSSEQNTVAILTEATVDAYKPFSHRKSGGYIYFDLWSYSFSLQLREILKAHDTVKGVIRLRRTTNDFTYIEQDILALDEWFGDVRNLTVRQNKIGHLHYTIVLCEFGESIMAHLEYMTGNERIELEWSSHLHIVEFDSLQMTADIKNNRTLYKNVDAIVQHAVHWSLSNDAKLTHVRALLKRGEQQ